MHRPTLAASRALRRAALAAFVALLATAGTAQAADPAQSTVCSSQGQQFQQVFNRAPWYDAGYYTLSPGGDMEGTMAGWTTSGGAAAVLGNESYNVGPVAGRRSLALPAGSSATSAPICVGL